jgi:DNA-binding phage protein
MALTRLFKATIQTRVQLDPTFGEALLAEGVDALLAGDLDGGKAVLRDYINATIGFERLATATGNQPKSLMRMFSRAGNPNARNLFDVLGELQRQSGVQLHAQTVREVAAR